MYGSQNCAEEEEDESDESETEYEVATGGTASGSNYVCERCNKTMFFGGLTPPPQMAKICVNERCVLEQLCAFAGLSLDAREIYPDDDLVEH